MSPFRVAPFAFVLGVVLAANTSVVAAEVVVDNCTVVKVEDGKLFITKKEGGEHSAPVAPDAKITVDGKSAKLTDLAAGTKVSLTLEKEDGKITITKIEGKSK